MCDSHFRSAQFNIAMENWMRVLGVLGAVLAGLFMTVMVLIHSIITGPEDLVQGLYAAGQLGLGIVVIVWTILSLSLRPFFTEPASASAHRAVRLRRYWPQDHYVRLEFQNEQLADIVLNTYPTARKRRSRLKLTTPRF